MTAPAATFNLSATLSATAGGVSVGDMLVPSTDGYVIASAANRALGGRSHGIALTAWGSTQRGAVRLQNVGVVDAPITGLGAGLASWVRVSSAGRLERCTPAGADDLVGYCWTDGTLLMLCGQWTATIINGSATLPIDLTSGVTGILPVANGGTGNAGTAIAIAALAINWALGDSFSKTLSAGSNTFTFANTSAKAITVRLTGATSTVTWPTVKWVGGVAPTQTSAGIDVYTFWSDGSTIFGSALQAFA